MKRGAEKITRRCLLFVMSAGLLLAQNPASEVRAMENVMESEDLTEDLIGSGTEFEGLLWNGMEDAGVLGISLEAETMTENAAVRSGNTISKDKVTFKTNGDYTHSIYANGMPLIIDATKAVNYAEIYVDLNENGVAEAGEELTDLRGDGKRTGILYRDGYGYFLSNSSIYGGAENGEYTYDTKITINGSANPGGGVPTVYEIFGGSESGTLTGNTSVCINGGWIVTVSGGGLGSAVTGNTDITVKGGRIDNVYASSAGQARLSYLNCGAAGNNWGAYDELNPYALQNAENPVLSCSSWNGNRFDCITFQDSYVNFLDTSNSNTEQGLRSAAKQLVIDGGALRIVGTERANLPDTIFRNNPLLIRSAQKEPISFQNASIEGNARVQWLGTDGVSRPNMSGKRIVDTESGVPNETFSAAEDGYGMKRESITYNNGDWNGTGWILDTRENLCTCSLSFNGLKESLFVLPAGKEEAEYTLEDVLVSGFNYENPCEMLEHKNTKPEAAYSLVPEATTAKGAAIGGDQLTVRGLGKVGVRVDRRLNQKSDSYTATVNIIQMPLEKEFTIVHEAEKDLVFDFVGLENAYFFKVYNSDQAFPGTEITTFCQVQNETDQCKCTLPASYLEKMDLGEHQFHIRIFADNASIFYDFTVKVTEPKEVTDPVIEIQGGPFHYDGQPKEPQVVVKDGDTVISDSEYTVSYENNTLAGTAAVVITDQAKGLYTVNGSAEFQIINEFQPQNGREYTTGGLNENGWANRAFTVTAKEGYQLSAGNTLSDNWTTSLTASGETNDGSLAFYVRNMENGRISLMAREAYKLDGGVPYGFGMTYQGSPVVTEIGADSFDLAYKEAVKVTLSAQDALSGIGQLAFYSSEQVLGREQLEQITGWVPGSSFSVEPVDGKQFIIYGRATDQAGNVDYFAGKGAEFDLKPPVFLGVEEAVTYYTTQRVIALDKNLEAVTRDGEPVSFNLLLEGNVDRTYILRAVDRAGNETALTVTMKPISSLMEKLAGLTGENVTSDDQYIINRTLDMLSDNDTTEEEHKALEQVQGKVLQLKERIDQAASAVQTEAVHKVKDISKENVRMEDREGLLQAKEALERALKEYSGNYTEEERRLIQEDISRMEAALGSITNVSEVVGTIEALPDVNQVSLDNEAAREAILQAKEAFDRLTEREQSLVEGAIVEKLEKLIKALTDYQIEKEPEQGSDQSKNMISPKTGDVDQPWSRGLAIAGAILIMYGLLYKKQNK